MQLGQPESIDEPAKRYFSIGEAAELLGINRSVLRFWETEFEDIRPRKTRKGRRMYSQADLDKLKIVYYLVKVRKFTLQGAREKLQADGAGVALAFKTRTALEEVKKFLIGLRDSL